MKKAKERKESNSEEPVKMKQRGKLYCDAFLMLSDKIKSYAYFILFYL